MKSGDVWTQQVNRYPVRSIGAIFLCLGVFNLVLATVLHLRGEHELAAGRGSTVNFIVVGAVLVALSRCFCLGSPRQNDCK